MVMCWAPDCKHYNQRDPCKFFRFSKNPNVRQKWKKLIRRSEEPGVGAYLCSCHFVDGKKENGPTLFLHNANKRLCFTSPEKRKRSKRSTETFDSESTAALGINYYEPISIGPTVKMEEMDSNNDEEAQELDESLQNVASYKKYYTDIKVKYLEEEHKMKMNILSIENKNAEIKNETFKIELEIKKIELAKERYNNANLL